MRIFIFWVLFWILYGSVDRAYCQQDVRLCMVMSTDSMVWKNICGRTFFGVVDSVEAVGRVDSLVQVLRRRGYLEASADKVSVEAGVVSIWVHIGGEYRLLSATLDSAVAERYKEVLRTGFGTNFERLEEAKKALEAEARHRGYPLAKARTDSMIVTAERTVYVHLGLEEGRFYTLGTLRHDSIARVHSRFLENYLSWKKGTPYDANLVATTYKRLRLLPYVGAVQKPRIVLNSDGTTDLLLVGKDKPISRLDGILGLAPNAQTGKVVLTGNILLDLQNTLGRGERLAVRWQQLRPQSQDLEVNASYPYLFNTPFGATADLVLVKMDTSYLDVTRNIAAEYRISGINYLRLGWGTLTTNVLWTDTNYIKQYNKLPPLVSVKQQALTFEAFWNNTDNFWLPHKGITTKIHLWWGNKQIQRSAAIEQLTDDEGISYTRLYDSIPLATFQVRALANVQHHWALAPNHTWSTGVNLGAIVSPQPIFTNEGYRLGGIRSIRGFAEASIPAQHYAILTGEYKLFFNELSYFHIFSDLCVTRRKVDAQWQYNNPIGIGAGMALATQAGTFQIQYALGTQQGVPLQLNNSKIHIGYINTF